MRYFRFHENVVVQGGWALAEAFFWWMLLFWAFPFALIESILFIAKLYA